MKTHRIHSPADGSPGAGPMVVLLHGGPGAPGTMAPVGRTLAARGFVSVEPFERRAGDEPLTVARHVADLLELLDALPEAATPPAPPAFVGSSWGAMLALAFAAAHPDRVGSLALVGCGTFDADTRALYRQRVERALGPELAARLGRLEAEIDDPDRRLAAAGRLLLEPYSVDLAPAPGGADPLELEACDARGHAESWADMLRLQEDGTYPQAFGAIRAPILMLHGDRDPHPGRAIFESLRPHLGVQATYRELAECGHYPWLERAAGEVFHNLLEGWLRAPGQA